MRFGVNFGDIFTDFGEFGWRIYMAWPWPGHGLAVARPWPGHGLAMARPRPRRGRAEARPRRAARALRRARHHRAKTIEIHVFSKKKDISHEMCVFH